MVPYVLPAGYSVLSGSLSAVGMLVPFGELEKDHSFGSIIDIVEHTVGSDSEAIFGGEPGHNELPGEFLSPFPLRTRIGCEQSDSGDNGFLIIGWNLRQRFLK